MRHSPITLLWNGRRCAGTIGAVALFLAGCAGAEEGDRSPARGSSAGSGGSGGADAGGRSETGGYAGGSGGGGTWDAQAETETGGGTTAGTGGSGADSGTQGSLTGAGHVRIEQAGATFTLLRDDQPYYIQGINGQAHMDLAAHDGANSTHTYDSTQAGNALDEAKRYGMTVMLGIELEQKPETYASESYKDTKRREIADLLTKYKDHPALLMWAVGNEVNLGADTQQAWEFVGELAEALHRGDPNHPTTTLLAGSAVTVINHVAAWAPAVDVLGINTYAAVTNVVDDVAGSAFKGPYIVTEWGPTGHWESPTTTWNRPIEQTSGAKARSYRERYEYISSHRDRGLGSYVFLWGQKQERTPTWYGMFLEDLADLGLSGESCPTVDVMAFEWSGAWPANRAPDVSELTLGGMGADASVVLSSRQSVTAEVTASDPDADLLHFVWEILEEPTDPGSNKGESRPPRVGAPQSGASPEITILAPSASGEYRLFVYALDGKGHAGTANLPFRVK